LKQKRKKKNKRKKKSINTFKKWGKYQERVGGKRINKKEKIN